MDILLVNKFFHPGAGAETAFFQTRDLLMDNGHAVIDFAMRDPANLPSPYSEYFSPRRTYGADTPALKRLADAAASVYSWSARRALARLLDVHRPEVAHLHNVYHQLTLSLIDELARRRIPIVLTLHDWKIACPAYTLFTEGAPCRRCPSGSVLNVVQHRCVKHSVGASAIAAGEAVMVRRRKLYDKVQRLIVPSRFGVRIARLTGVASERVIHVPNFLSENELAASASPSDGPRLVYAGRLEETKGIRTLLAAFAMVHVPATLRIAGAGALDSEVRTAAAHDPRIVPLGRLPRDEMYAELGRARAVVLPSLYEDNGPLTILEAQTRAKPIIVSDRGGLPEFVDHQRTGLVVAADDPRELATAMTRMAADSEAARDWGLRAQEHVRTEHAPDRHYRRLLEVYSEAMGVVA